MSLFLNAFSDGFQTHCMADIIVGLHDGGVHRVMQHIAHESTVYLEEICSQGFKGTSINNGC